MFSLNIFLNCLLVFKYQIYNLKIINMEKINGILRNIVCVTIVSIVTKLTSPAYFQVANMSFFHFCWRDEKSTSSKGVLAYPETSLSAVRACTSYITINDVSKTRTNGRIESFIPKERSVSWFISNFTSFGFTSVLIEPLGVELGLYQHQLLKSLTAQRARLSNCTLIGQVMVNVERKYIVSFSKVAGMIRNL